MGKHILALVAACNLAALVPGAAAEVAGDLVQKPAQKRTLWPSQKQTAPQGVPGWAAFAEELRMLDTEVLAKLPENVRNDPQARQEAGRLLLEALAARTLDVLGSDGDHPAFVPWIGATLNVLQPNADTIYRKAVITPGGSYRIRGERGSLRIAKIGQSYTMPEETGKANPGIGILTYHDINALRVDEQGRFDVILSPQRPEGYGGDWWELKPRTHALLLRLVAFDWAHERDPKISIERLDLPVRRTRPAAAELEKRLRGLAAGTRNTALVLVDHVGQLRKDGAVNKLQEWNVGGVPLSKVGGLVGQFYYEGAYEIAADEALLLEVKLPEKCHYWSVILTNDVYETTDWYNSHSSLNGAQARLDGDGMFRAVISDRDPGVPNWLDTASYLTGAVQGRWTDCSGEPVLPTLRKVMLTDVRRELPAGTPYVSPQEREQAVRERRAQLQWRPQW